MNKKFLGIVGGIVLVLALTGGAFLGGMQFERFRVNNAQARFFAGRGGGQDGQGAGGGQGGQGGGFFGGGGPGGAGRGGTIGQIKTIEGDTLTISTPQSVVIVKITASTLVSKTVSGAASDLQVGTNVIVRGETDASGNVTATTIQISPNRVGP